MTENAAKRGREALDPLSMARLVDASLRPGGSMSATFSDGVVHVTLDQTGDWTITAGLSLRSDRLISLTRSLKKMGFFQAAEQGGMVYHLWTSALENHDAERSTTDILFRVLVSFQVSPFGPSYIS